MWLYDSFGSEEAVKMRQERRKGVYISTKGTYISLAFKNLYKLIFCVCVCLKEWKFVEVSGEHRGDSLSPPNMWKPGLSIMVIDISFMTPTLICFVLLVLMLFESFHVGYKLLENRDTNSFC